MVITTLDQGWTLRAVSGPVPESIAGQVVPAHVPGTVHTDLLTAGLIVNPYVDLAETELAWMHRVDWRYERPLTIEPAADDERVDLVLEGLDTVATITLGGVEVARTANMHRSYRFDVRALATGETDLVVDLASALTHAEQEALRIGGRPGAYPAPLNMVRKMACSFGWDWGPDLQTAGLWKPASIQRWRTARIASVRPLVTVAGSTARVAVHVDVERSGLDELPVDLRVRVGDVVATGALAAGATSAVLDVTIPDAALWWPVGHGAQPLYETDVELTVAGERLDGWHRRIGLRTVDLDTSADEHGSAFVLRINGKPVFVRGANWIPDDHLLTRITRERLNRRIDQAVGAHLNLLRVWGGGVYESEDFYDVCDEAGIMVWQDFPLACAAYPEEEPHRSEFEAEAREHVTRLSAHPSLVIWNGGNENLWGFEDWGWQDSLEGRSWGAGYYHDLFPSIVAELDPTRPYTPGSPSSPAGVHPNDPDHGTHHEWEVWNRVDYTAYRADIPRFCSEFGFQGPPAWSTLERAVRNADGAPLEKEDAVFLLHQKADDGNGKLDRGMAPHLGVPADFSDWHWATQLNQARAVAHAVTHYRSWWPRTAGAIVWQLNDCWPVTSWAAVDGDERRKPLWHALRASFADRILTVQVRDELEVLAAVNDSDERWVGPVAVRRERFDGTVLAETVLVLDAPARSVETLDLPVDLRTPVDPRGEVLVAELGDVRTAHTWLDDVELDLAPSPVRTSVERVADGYLVTLTATSLARDVTLLADRADPDACVDESLVTLPAGASTTVHVRSTRTDLADALVRTPVLRSANEVSRTRAPAS